MRCRHRILLSIFFGNWVIRKLISLKFGQPIRTKEEVNKLFELHGSKKGTPTMGGILIIGSILISTLLWAMPENPFVWLVLFSTLFLGGIGFYDDWLKVSKKNSKGISSRLKFALQCLLAGIFTAFFLFNPKLAEMAKQLYIPFFKDPIIFLGAPFTFVFYLLVIVGTSNAVNLTDGLDGLASGCTATVAAAYAALAYLAGNIKAAGYLQIPTWFIPMSWPWFAPRCWEPAWASSGGMPIRPACSWATPVLWRSVACWVRWPSAANRRSSWSSWAAFSSWKRCP